MAELYDASDEMTTKKPELMPEHVWVDDMCTAGTREFGGSTEYTRTDLYTSACAERDALRELCEGMAGALKEANAIFNNEGWGKYTYMEGDVFEGASNASTSITKALAAYEKHKAGE